MLSIAVGSVAFVVAHAEATRIDFENEALWGKHPAFGLDDDGQTGATSWSYWYFSGGATNANDSVMRAYEPGEPIWTGAGKTARKGFLEVATDAGLMLERTFAEATAAGPDLNNPYPIPVGTGLVLDMLVRFDAGRTYRAASDYAAEGNKLACWPYAASAGDAPKLVVSAGRIEADGSLGAANYEIASLDGVPFAFGTWYRLTAKVVANAATKAGVGVPAFALYVNGEPVVCEPAAYAAAIGPGAEEVFRGNELYGRGALFPSLQRSGGRRSSTGLYSLGMSGRLGLDELTLRPENPFDDRAEEIDFTVVFDSRQVLEVTNEVVRAVGDAAETNLTTATTFKVRPGDRVTVLPVLKANCRCGEELTLSGNVRAGSSEGHVVTLESGASFASSEGLVARLSSENLYFRVGDECFTTFAEAIEGSSPSNRRRLSLLTDVTLSPDPGSDNGQARVRKGQCAVLDLCGHTITGEHFDDEAAIYNQGLLTVVNSDPRGAGGIVAPGKVIENDWTEVSTNLAVNVNESRAELVLGDEASFGFTVCGRVVCTSGSLVLRGGTYLTPEDEPKETFYLAPYVDGDGRFGAEREVDDAYWTVTYDDKLRVDFVSPRGEVVPFARTMVEKGATVEEAPEVAAPGFRLLGWRAPGAAEYFRFGPGGDVVTESVTLTAELETLGYFVSYDRAAEFPNPVRYTVTNAYEQLYDAVNPNARLFTFAGWVATNVGYRVKGLGEGARFWTTGGEETDREVTGDLALVAQWLPTPRVWSNTQAGLSESNGVYAGTWQMRLPAEGAVITNGMAFRIREIDFCLVNPAEITQTAPRLAVTANGVTSYSDVRPTYLGAEGEYLVGTNWLGNARPALRYVFGEQTPTVRVSRVATVAFADAERSPVPAAGFLRLGHNPLGVARNAVISNCVPETATPPADVRYGEFCPLYEIHGEAVPE